MRNTVKPITQVLTPLLLALSMAGAEDMDFGKAAQQAVKAGNLTEAKRLCDQWAKAKPNDARPHLVLGRLYVKQKLIDKALEAFETAREVNPLSPEPACEVGKLFLMAGMGQEAAAEFQAALKVRKDYAPAVKGLAQAEALLADPYANGVHIKLCEHNSERGLKQTAADETRVTTIGGRPCRATDKAKNRYFLYLDVSDEYLSDVDVPVRVTVEYYDLGKGNFDLNYDSADMGAFDQGIRKTPPSVRRTNSKTWKTATFNLPDARFANRGWWGADLAICSRAWGSGEDVYVSSVHVVRGGLAVSAEPAAAVADGTSACAVTAKVFDAMGLVADGTVVRFTTDRGAIDPEVKTVDGRAQAVFKPGEEPGEAAITVRAGKDERALYLPVLAGRGKILRRALVLDRLDRDRGWRFRGLRGGQATFQPAPDELREGRPSMRAVYRLRPNLSSSVVSFERPISVPGRPVKFGLWVKMDGSGNRVQVVLIDATGQTLVFRLGYVASEGWHWMEHDIGDAVYRRGGANDGRVHLPVRFDALQIGRYYGGRGKANGEICVQDLTVVADVPRSITETVIMDAGLAEPDGHFGAVYYLPRPAPFRVGLTHLGDGAKLGWLRWQVADERDEVIVEGRSDDLRIDSGSKLSVPVAVALSNPGAYQARFTLEVEGEAEPTSTEMRFLALRDMPQSNPAGQIRRQEKDIAVRLDNRTGKATQFALSYQLLNAQYEVVRKGMPDEPKMKLEPGEVLDVSVSLQGLEAGRYRALLLFDMAGGERFTRLLPVDVYPDVITVPVKVVTEDQSAVRNANVRARLVQRPHRRVDNQDRTLQKWDVQTDEAGQCELPELRVPGDPDLYRVYFDVVAEGLQDTQHTAYLNRLVSFDVTPRPAHTVRMSRGVALTGRVVGGDGEPVSGARVAAMGVLKKDRAWRIHLQRPRTTNADGRFELNVSPNMNTELTVYSARWAPKVVLVPVGKRDSGDIRLQPGAVVKGTFLDEQGKPVSEHWVVLESSQIGPSSIMVSPAVVAARTGPDGTFVLPPLKGPCVLSTPASFQPWWTEGRRHSPQPRIVALPQALTLDRDDVELELHAIPQVRVGGRVLDIDGTEVRDVRLRLSHSKPICRAMSDQAVTDESGRYVFKGIPSGLSGLRVSISTLRRWKRDKKIYLRARPIEHEQWQNGLGAVAARDVLDLDFQFCFWTSKDGFMDTSPDGEPVPRPKGKPGLMAGLGKALQGIAKSLAQTTSLNGRVLDKAGEGLRGAQVQVVLVNVGQGRKEQRIGSRNVRTGADGTYLLATAPISQPAEQCRVRVEVVAEGYAKIQKEFTLRELMKPGTRALRIPDLRLAPEDNE